MSAQDNKNLVRRYQEIYNRNDLAALDEVRSKDLLTLLIMPGIPAGLEGAKAAHRIMLKGFPDFHTHLEDLIAESDKVAARITMAGTHRGEFLGVPATGRRIEFTGMYIVQIRDGKILAHWGEEDGVSLLRQLGLLP